MRSGGGGGGGGGDSTKATMQSLFKGKQIAQRPPSLEENIFLPRQRRHGSLFQTSNDKAMMNVMPHARFEVE